MVDSIFKLYKVYQEVSVDDLLLLKAELVEILMKNDMSNSTDKIEQELARTILSFGATLSTTTDIVEMIKLTYAIQEIALNEV